MGHFYFTGIRCSNEHCAKFLAEKYHGLTYPVTRGTVLAVDPGRLRTSTYTYPDDPSEHWVDICDLAITDTGICSETEADKANQYCNFVHGLLRNDWMFDYAISGVEAGAFLPKAELIDMMKVGQERYFGLIVSKAFFAENGIHVPSNFVEFSPSHVWIPKELETVPVYSR